MIRASIDIGSFPFVDPARVQASIRAAMQAGVEFARALWLRRAQDLRVRASGAYLRGIEQAEIAKVSETLTDDRLRIVWEIRNTAPHADVVENGHSAFHLPDRIDWSGPRVKRGRNGPYLNIPLEHAAFQSPAERKDSGATVATLRRMMPEEVYRRALRLTRTIPKLQGPIRSASGQFLRADNYEHGTGRRRLSMDLSGPRTVVGLDGVAYELWRGPRAVQGRTAGGRRLTNPAWSSPKHEGMIKTGPKGHTKYLTIRTITPNSQGWNIPAQQGLGIARQVQGALNNGVGSERFHALLVQAAQSAMFRGGG